MLKFRARHAAAMAAGALLLGSTADAVVLGPAAGLCTSGKGPAVLVHVTGLRNRAGTVRARLFPGNNPNAWFNKKMHIGRILAPTPDAGPVDICVPVPRPGNYVVDVRHDINNNSDTDRADGGGASGNPKIGMLDVLFGRKPPARQVVFSVGQGVTPITITVRYAS